MATTYKLISSVTVGSGGAASMNFTSIPQTYTDLQMLVTMRKATSDSTDLRITFNGVTSGYFYRHLKGNGATVYGGGQNNSSYYYIEDVVPGSDYTANTFGSATIYIPNYTSSNAKSMSTDGVSENNSTTAFINLNSGLTNATAAITSIGINAATGNLAQYSTAYLYGISNA
jgi:hypothetical protein